tara:strand:+ start:1700 stop:1915 length:216 start_codon:yes stop_codon:yes gene_type:complete
MNEWRLAQCECGHQSHAGRWIDKGISKPHPHHTYDGDYCGEMGIINEPSPPLHWPLIEALVFYKWELEGEL